MKRTWLSLLVLLSLGIYGHAQNFTNATIENYINQYKGLAMSEQIRTGVPASITLAQGIFETGGGTSELCLNAHNHFGVKCKGKWQGETYSYDDDQKDECFRKYQNDRQSYMDHSNFLKNNPRYARLFKIDPKHYRKWAEGLRECGYATNKQYAHKLIGYIEQYNLEQYTIQALADAQFVAAHGNDDQNTELLTADNGLSGMAQVVESATPPIDEESASASSENNIGSKQTIARYEPENWDTVQFYTMTEKNGLKGFYAPKGDLLLEYAIKHYIRYGKLLSMNDLPDEPLAANMFIYLEKKRKKGLTRTFQVPPDMDLIQVSQATAVDLEQLRLLNHLQPGENPAPGAILQLQEMAAAKPSLAINKPDNQLKTSVKPLASANSEDDYVVLQKEEQSTEIIAEQEKPQTLKENESKEQSMAQATIADKAQVEVAATASEDDGKDSQDTDTDSFEGDSQMSKLEKLRAKMNGIVYGDKASPASVVEDKEIKTVPPTKAKENAPSVAQNPNDKLRAYMATVKENQLMNDEAQDTYTTLPAGQMQVSASSASTSVSTTQASIAKNATKYYTVQRGDTAFSIAKKFGISLTQLKDWNRLPKSMVVQVGEKLKVAP